MAFDSEGPLILSDDTYDGVSVIYGCGIDLYPNPIIFKQVSTLQGHFKISFRGGWIPSDTVLMDSQGVIHWHINSPSGILMKYPCGTKRFVKHDV